MSDTVETQVDPDEPKGLRKQLADAHAKLKVYETKDREAAFSDAGLDVSTGMGKAISQVYDGEVTSEAITKFAKDEYGYEVPVDDTNPQAQQIAEAQQRLDNVTQTAGSVADPTQGDVLAKAEAEGDYQTTLAMKGQQLADML